ncbi:hypothetical protein AB4Z17_24485 [Paenibacillus sp. TAF43_2]|uniref:hypothetical protein n=1 Tax=Paenibacillus sp. TAF43_2 TaxID=3233069 RepID=UPI003F98BD3C
MATLRSTSRARSPWTKELTRQHGLSQGESSTYGWVKPYETPTKGQVKQGSIRRWMG